MKWNAGQPDNAQGVEQCLSVMNDPTNSQTFTINDCECSTKIVLQEMRFICEKTRQICDQSFQIMPGPVPRPINSNVPKIPLRPDPFGYFS